MAQKQTAYRPIPTNPNTPAVPAVRDTAIEDLDDFLDDIDACLEENELEVVRAFVQRGGQ